MLKTRNTLRQLAHDCLFRRIHGSRLIYNTCWEDPALDRELMRLGPDSRVVMITSAGCNALNYLLDSPREIHCVDVNPRQNALLHLKMAAAARLSHDDFFQLFGLGRHEHIDRIFEQIKFGMPDFSRNYWAKRLHSFSGRGWRKSFYFHGASGDVALMIRHYLNTRRELRDQLFALLDCGSLAEQQAIYERIEPEFWNLFTRLLVANPVVMAMVGVPRPQLQLIRESYPGGLSAYVRDKLRRVFTELPLRDNYFWRVYIRGEYTRSCCPDYLREENFALLQSRLDRIHTYDMSVTEFLQRYPGDYSHYVLLDHQDWLAAHDESALEEEWMHIIHNSDAGGKVLMRSAAEEVRFIPALVTANLKMRPELTTALHRRDRVGTYGNLTFAEVC